MSIVPKAFYGFLILVMLASFVGGWQSLAKLHQQNEWPGRYDQEEYYRHELSWFASLTLNTVRFLDSIVGKITCLALITAISFGCGKLAFQFDYLYTGLLALLAFATSCAWIAIKLRFLDPFTPIIRM
jgi:hypothetical protein